MILVPFSAYAQNLAVEQVRQCLLGCLAGLLKLLVRASQATFSVDQLVGAQGPRFQGNPAGFQGNPAGECAGWCTGLRRFGMVGLGVCVRVGGRQGGLIGKRPGAVNIGVAKRISMVSAACQMAPSVGTVPWSTEPPGFGRSAGVQRNLAGLRGT